MKTYAKDLFKEMDRQLETILAGTGSLVERSENAITVMVGIMEKLKAFCNAYQFANSQEEIEFFRDIKPRFACRLIYYNEIYNIESNRPFGTAKTVRKYYNAELDKLKVFFEENLEFYRYYRKGTGLLDDKYFVRGQHDVRLALDSFYLQADHCFSTSHDFKTARILANDLIREHLESEIQNLEERDNTAVAGGRPLKWTGSKVGIIELIYALHTEGVFNHGSSDLKEITSFFARSFEIDLTQFHRTFYEISARKSGRTKFLDSLQQNLLRRMDDRDAK